MQTELEVARKHLLDCQRRLHQARTLHIPYLADAECSVLAALSWVWDAQQRETIEQMIRRQANFLLACGKEIGRGRSFSLGGSPSYLQEQVAKYGDDTLMAAEPWHGKVESMGRTLPPGKHRVGGVDIEINIPGRKGS